MSGVIDYYFAPISPWAYLGGPRLADMAGRHRARVRVKPVDLGYLFPRTGGLPLARRALERQAYRLMELMRWRDYLGMPLVLRPRHFPVKESLAASFIISAGKAGGDALALANAIGAALWAEDRNVAELATLQDICRTMGFHDNDLAERASDPEVERTFRAYTEEALANGVFGAPTYLYDGELFWGQDRLDFLERALGA